MTTLVSNLLILAPDSKIKFLQTSFSKHHHSIQVKMRFINTAVLRVLLLTFSPLAILALPTAQPATDMLSILRAEHIKRGSPNNITIAGRSFALDPDGSQRLACSECFFLCFLFSFAMQESPTIISMSLLIFDHIGYWCFKSPYWPRRWMPGPSQSDVRL